MSRANTEADYYARAIGQLGRALRGVSRYERSHGHGDYGRAKLAEATAQLREAMKKVGAAHKAAEHEAD